jgi:hypothetical protein
MFLTNRMCSWLRASKNIIMVFVVAFTLRINSRIRSAFRSGRIRFVRVIGKHRVRDRVGSSFVHRLPVRVTDAPRPDDAVVAIPRGVFLNRLLVPVKHQLVSKSSQRRRYPGPVGCSSFHARIAIPFWELTGLAIGPGKLLHLTPRCAGVRAWNGPNRWSESAFAATRTGLRACKDVGRLSPENHLRLLMKLTFDGRISRANYAFELRSIYANLLSLVNDVRVTICELARGVNRG